MTQIPGNRKNRYWYPASWGVGLLFALLLGGLTFLARGHIFFWDTIQFAGKHGLWFYDHHFSDWLLPPEIDSGHPPVFGWYIAGLWAVFGKSLAVSHWAMYPFLLGIVWQLLRAGRYWLVRLSPVYLLLVAFADPVLLGQSVLVSPDIALLFFFLWALNGWWRRQPIPLATAMLGQAAISTRGMMLVAALGVSAFLLRWPPWRRIRRGKDLEWLLPYLPAGIFGALFLWIHYRHTGWIGYHADSPWAPGFERADLRGILRNLALLGWRWLDYGRIFLWLVLGWLVYRSGRRTVFRPGSSSEGAPPVRRLLLLFGVTALFLAFPFLSYRGLHAHRYLLPVFLLFSLLCLIFVDRLAKGWRRSLLILLMVLGLAGGNRWIYPDRIAQGWDATLAHWPYYRLREQMLDYLNREGIPLSEVGTAFPDIGPLRDRDLSGRTEGFRNKDLSADRWILYSNIMNDFSDAELEVLSTNWRERVRFESGGIKMVLYQRSGTGKK